ncbi:hypothetical protein MOUN0_M07514 [Monosporozyma unispora]|nr:hypothetical protein C6P44_000222 [Kazachstania unispora]
MTPNNNIVMQTDDFQNLNSDILRKCSGLALNMNMLPMTFSLLAKLLSYDSTDIRSLLLLSNAYLKNKNYINVIHLLIDAINSKTDFIINDYRIWKQLAFAYYKLNKYDDADHAISQALSSISSPRMAFERQQLHIDNNHNNTSHGVKTYIEGEAGKTIHHPKSYTMLLPKDEEEILKYKISVLNCRISLLAPEKTHSISLLLSDFQMALSQIDFNKNIPLYLEVLITRAQLFIKYHMIAECKQDLIQCLTILNENKQAFKRNDLSPKVAYCYYFLISLEFLQNSDFDLSMKLIKEVQTNFQLPALYLQKFLILEAYIRTINNPHNSRFLIDRLKMEIPLVSDLIKPRLFYALGRLVIQDKTDENIELAYHFYQDALSITPEDPIIWVSFAALYFELGQFDDALSTYSQAASLASSSEILQSCNLFQIRLYNKLTALAWFGISQVYCAINQLSNAVDSINEAIGIFRIENDKVHAEELERIRTELQILQNKYRRYKESRTVQQLINSEEGHPNDDDDDDDDYMNDSAKSDSQSNIDYLVPDIPFEMLIEFETYQDQNVFTTECELDPVNLTEVKEDKITSKIESVQQHSNPIIVSNNVTNLVPSNINNGSVIKLVHASANHVAKPMIHQRSHNSIFEDTPPSDSDKYLNANKYVIIPNQRFQKKVTPHNHTPRVLKSMIPISAGVPTDNNVDNNIFNSNGSPMS